MLTTSNLTWDRKVNQILLSTSVMFCLTIFCLLLKSEINHKTEANFFTMAEKEYEKAKLEAREDKIIEREQIVLQKQIKETCHSNQNALKSFAGLLFPYKCVGNNHHSELSCEIIIVIINYLC